MAKVANLTGIRELVLCLVTFGFVCKFASMKCVNKLGAHVEDN